VKCKINKNIVIYSTLSIKIWARKDTSMACSNVDNHCAFLYNLQCRQRQFAL